MTDVVDDAQAFNNPDWQEFLAPDFIRYWENGGDVQFAPQQPLNYETGSHIGSVSNTSLFGPEQTQSSHYSGPSQYSGHGQMPASYGGPQTLTSFHSGHSYPTVNQPPNNDVSDLELEAHVPALIPFDEDDDIAPVATMGAPPVPSIASSSKPSKRNIDVAGLSPPTAVPMSEGSKRSAKRPALATKVSAKDDNKLLLDHIWQALVAEFVKNPFDNYTDEQLQIVIDKGRAKFQKKYSRAAPGEFHPFS
jgi:hypothetical protein